MKNVKPVIIQHPSTPDSVKRPHLPAEDALQEALPLLIEVLLDWLEWGYHEFIGKEQ